MTQCSFYVGAEVWEKLTASNFTEEEWGQLTKEVQCSSETLIPLNQTTRRQIQQNHGLNIHRLHGYCLQVSNTELLNVKLVAYKDPVRTGQ